MDQTRQARKRKEIYRARILLNKTEIEIIQYMRFYFIKLTLSQRERIDIKISNFLGRRVRFIYSDSPRIKFRRREGKADSSIYRERNMPDKRDEIDRGRLSLAAKSIRMKYQPSKL